MITDSLEYKQYKKDLNEKWLDKNAGKATLLSSSLMSLRPDMGFFIVVEKIEIMEDIFPEEYKQITEAYFSVIEKMEKHYYDKIAKNKKL